MPRNKSRELFIYMVEKDTHIDYTYQTYKLTKGGTLKGTYTICIPPDYSNETVSCNCPGFSMQKYAKIEHKHIQLVLAFIKQDKDTNCRFILDKNNQVILIGGTNG